MKLIFRIVLDVCIVIAVLNGWWPLAIVLVLIGAWFFRFFVEIILAGVAYDALFGMGHGMGWRGYEGTIGAVVIFVAVKLAKRLVR
jgi:hypothetical protein